MTEVKFEILADAGDARGRSHAVHRALLDFLDPGLCEVHVTTIREGCVRGNHAHMDKREVIVVIHEGQWSLHWDLGPGTQAHHQEFTGRGSVAIQVSPGSAHAIRNDGPADLVLVALSDREYDARRPDSLPRTVVP